ncbi:MAG: helix-turn-helix domain-containing protein [Lachnospiraceae bacterium]|nr:helix-turn-helix domain-containing protein [Lachnospiraceae bacterium]
MDIKLAGNLKRMRKERSLTQEALAEALGVTAGAVYKWEAGLSTPELEMLVRIADLFDTSVDTLLGYEMAENRKRSITDQIYGYILSKDRAGLEYAEKALTKYSNDFNVLVSSARMYLTFGMEERNNGWMRRAIELFEKASETVPHDIDPRYGRLAIIGDIALLNFLVNDRDKALEMMKKNNEAGVFNAKIGWLTALKGETDAACLNMLTTAFCGIIGDTANTSMGLLYYYCNRHDWKRAKAVARWNIDYLKSLRKNDKPCFFDKLNAAFLISESYAYFMTGNKVHAKELIDEAKRLAEYFDAAPNENADIVKLFDISYETSTYTMLGRTGEETIRTVLDMMGDKKFTAFANK